MKGIFAAIVAGTLAVAITGCATEVPRTMQLADPAHRHTVDNPGTDIKALRHACAETMLNASPSAIATDINVRVLSAGNPAILDVDAILPKLGFWKQDLPVTFHCEYQDGHLKSFKWTRGLKG